MMSIQLGRRRHAQAWLSVAAMAAAGLPVHRALAQMGTEPSSDGQGSLIPEGFRQVLLEREIRDGRAYAAAAASRAGREILYAGRRSAQDPREPDDRSRFEWGSITEVFTALLLAEAAQRKELALTDPVESILGYRMRDSTGDPIRWLDLATHRSGLPRLTTRVQPASSDERSAVSVASALRSEVQAWKPQVPRQARFEHSTLGFGLLAHALGLQTRQSYGQRLRERVLTPLGLETSIDLALPGTALAELLEGHDDAGRAVQHQPVGLLAGGTGLFGTAPALARFCQAALGLVDTPLAPAFRLAFTRHAPGPNDRLSMGLGWVLGTLSGRTVAMTSGATAGFSGSLFLDLDRARLAFVLANAFVPVDDLSMHLLDPALPHRGMVSGRQRREQPALAVPAQDLEPLAGRYAFNASLQFLIMFRQGRLIGQVPGVSGIPEFELHARTSRHFFVREANFDFVFDGEKGVPAALTLVELANGKRQRFIRQP